MILASWLAELDRFDQPNRPLFVLEVLLSQPGRNEETRCIVVDVWPRRGRRLAEAKEAAKCHRSRSKGVIEALAVESTDGGASVRGIDDEIRTRRKKDRAKEVCSDGG